MLFDFRTAQGKPDLPQRWHRQQPINAWVLQNHYVSQTNINLGRDMETSFFVLPSVFSKHGYSKSFNKSSIYSNQMIVQLKNGVFQIFQHFPTKKMVMFDIKMFAYPMVKLARSLPLHCRRRLGFQRLAPRWTTCCPDQRGSASAAPWFKCWVRCWNKTFKKEFNKLILKLVIYSKMVIHYIVFNHVLQNISPCNMNIVWFEWLAATNSCIPPLVRRESKPSDMLS